MNELRYKQIEKNYDSHASDYKNTRILILKTISTV